MHKLKHAHGSGVAKAVALLLRFCRPAPHGQSGTPSTSPCSSSHLRQMALIRLQQPDGGSAHGRALVDAAAMAMASALAQYGSRQVAIDVVCRCDARADDDDVSSVTITFNTVSTEFYFDYISVYECHDADFPSSRQGAW